MIAKGCGRFWMGLALILAVHAAAVAQTPKRPNVLFIAVDDLRPSFGAYGGPIKTPNLDRLARRGTTFLRAYCQQAVCSPSRTSLLTGRRPDTTRIYDLQTHFRLYLPDVTTLPQHFKANGYHTQALSKIYHPGLDDKASWSVPSWWPTGGEYKDPETLAYLKAERERLRAEGTELAAKTLETDPKTGVALRRRNPAVRVNGPAWESWDAPDSAYPDGKTAEKAIAALRERKAENKPFFLAVGFLKPHLPFVAPKRYYDQYPLGNIKIAANPYLPKNAPSLVTNGSGELRSYRGIARQGPPVTDEQARALIRGYYAAASFMDAQVGRVLDELERLGLADNTIVVLWGDHGWQLGEHGLWTKHTNFEIATRSPLLLHVPGQKNPGAKTKALVEFVDIYPTLCEAAGLPIPEGLAGRSLLPLLADPDARFKTAAFSQYPRRNVMGYSIRTDRWRYTEWGDRGAELYDHTADPDENESVAARSENRAVVESLRRELHAALPGAAEQARKAAAGSAGKGNSRRCHGEG